MKRLKRVTLREKIPMKEFSRLNLNGLNIKDLEDPSLYVSTLLSLIENAQSRIILSALYFGTGPDEQTMIKSLEQAMSDSKRPNLRISFLLDHSRAQRGKISSVSMLANLVDRYHPRFEVLLYQMPQLRSGLYSFLPMQLRELIGVYHCKFNMIDDNIILTGANLSGEYFNSRQDRYLLFTANSFSDRPDDRLKQNNLLNYLNQFTAAVSSDCHNLLPGCVLKSPLKYSGLNLQGKLRQLKHDINCNDKSSMTYLCPAIQHGPLQINEEVETLTALVNSRFASLPGALIAIATPYSNYRFSFLKAILNVLDRGSKGLQNVHSKVRLTAPSIQAHGFGSATGVKGYVPYLHHYSQLFDTLSVLEAQQHRSNERNMDNCCDSNDSNDPFLLPSSSQLLTLNYYTRADWTFHSKGIWIFPPSLVTAALHNNNINNSRLFNNENASSSSSSSHPGNNDVEFTIANSVIDNSISNAKLQQHTQEQHRQYHNNNIDSAIDNDSTDIPVCCSYIGSSNFGERSWCRDFELGFVLVTRDPAVQTLLVDEYSRLQSRCFSTADFGMSSIDSRTSSSSHSANTDHTVAKTLWMQRQQPLGCKHQLPVQLPQQHDLHHYYPNRIGQWILYAVARVLRSIL